MNVHHKMMKDAYWNPCGNHSETLCFRQLQQKQVQPQLRTARGAGTQVRMCGLLKTLPKGPQS